MGVGRLQRHVTAGQQPLGLLDVGRPALGDHGGAHRAAQRVAHPLEVDRRPAVQQGAAGDPGHCLRHRGDVDELRLTGVQPPHHLGIGRLHLGLVVAIEPVEHGYRSQVTAGRDAPVDLLHRHILRAEGLSEHR